MRSATLVFLLMSSAACAQNAAVTVAIDATAKVHPVSPLIYGVAFGTASELDALNAPLNRSGGNNTSTYNYVNNAQNLDNDYFFESYPQQGTAAGAEPDGFVLASLRAGAVPMITVPLIGWTAKLGANRAILPSFSVKKYGPQCSVDPYFPDAGDGIKTDCTTDITGNDPTDAYVSTPVVGNTPWLKHLVKRWGAASAGGVGYYLMDNEPSIWFGTHRDIHPVGPHANEYLQKTLTASKMVKSIDPSALVVAPEEWGWEAYTYSGYDQQYAAAHGYSSFPDFKNEQGGVPYIPWLLSKWKAAGHPVDVLSVHFYPQGAEFTNDVSTATQLLRNRSTRQLWDPNYVSESWIDAPVYLIPRMQGWISQYYYAGTPIAITEYNWGAEGYINGATTQADILGIFGAYGLNMATRWTVPALGSPTFKSMQMYRNYDGKKSTFGETSVSAVAPDPDDLSAFAALRASDGALTVMVISKVLSGTTPLSLSLAHFGSSGTAQAYQLTSANKIVKLAPRAWSGGVLKDTLPAQSITLYLLPKST
jgi:hypothetical protein